MKKTGIFLAAILFFVSNLVIAQHQGGGHPGGGHKGPPPIPNEREIVKMVNELSDELGLTSDVKKEVLDLHVEHFRLMKEKTGGNQRPEKREMDAQRKKFDDSIKALLNEEQKVKYDALMKKKRPHNPPKR